MARTFAQKVQSKLNKGWRKEAKHVGQLWKIVKPGDEALVATNQFYYVTKWNVGQDIEAEPISFFYRVRGDRTPLINGHMLIGLDPSSKYEQEARAERYTISTMRLLRDNIAIRTDDAVTIYRPTQRTLSNNVDPSYNLEVPANAKILAFNTSTRSWAFVDQPTSNPLTTVWTGINMQGAGLYALSTRVPLSVSSSGWTISCGLLPGVQLREGDIVVSQETKEWYRIDNPYYQIESASLYQMGASKVRT